MFKTAINALWYLGNIPNSYAFRKAALHPERVQLAKLFHYLKSNAYTEFGQQHNFKHIKTFSDYQKCVPIRDYNEFRPWIQNIIEGKANILTSDNVLCLMPTSGATGDIKLIPYTHELQKEFSQGVAPWINNVFKLKPTIMSGSSYWSIAPNLIEYNQKSAVKIGYAEESTYLTNKIHELINSVIAVPNSLIKLSSVDSFNYLTLLYLIACNDLRFISVWHPYYFSQLLEQLEGYWQSLLHDLATGSISLNEKIDIKEFRIQPVPKRSEELAKLSANQYSRIWPELSLISCWGEGNSVYALKSLAQKFPQAIIQEKGLIATEAFISFPLGVNQNIKPISVNSHFFEFINDKGQSKLVNELRQGEEYNLVVSTAGGLYRYFLQDRIKVVDFFYNLPCLRFIGKPAVN
ncbi:GH3 family domain-containing protein [Zooshikella harenae]|uniref:GH3 auxin-responsive promoter family protein n=1 Tax=Zooshikella harenae TaxID=2827238 RepID=A0ABS5Z5Y4_9GAMM|nr:GH3 auxin-responsive promoter family protein [Zooshikella harenae]MBU2709462.1 GH3 auxin-responsive promoter family protein [Zooshikella harenae]